MSKVVQYRQPSPTFSLISPRFCTMTAYLNFFGNISKIELFIKQITKSHPIEMSQSSPSFLRLLRNIYPSKFFFFSGSNIGSE